MLDPLVLKGLKQLHIFLSNKVLRFDFICDMHMNVLFLSSMGNTPFVYLVAMKCFHRGHPLLHRLLLFLNLGDSTPREDYQFSIPWGIITPQRELSPLSEHPRGLSPPREHDHLSLSTLGGLSPPLEDYHLVLSTLGDYHPQGDPYTPRKSDLEFFIGVLHPLPLFPTNVLVVLFVYI